MKPIQKASGTSSNVRTSSQAHTLCDLPGLAAVLVHRAPVTLGGRPDDARPRYPRVATPLQWREFYIPRAESQRPGPQRTALRSLAGLHLPQPGATILGAFKPVP